MERARPAFCGTPRLRLASPLGAGGMGVVFEAIDRDDGSHLALKVLPNVTPESVVAFKTEFRSLQGIHHPNLVTLGELIEHEGHLFFTMELIRGVDILSYVRVQPRSTPPSGLPLGELSSDEPTARAGREGDLARQPREKRAAQPAAQPNEARLRTAFLQLARGLAALHGAAKVHRDVKPSNVLVTQEGRAVLLDFGLVVDVGQSSRLSDGALGTVSYVSPEQAAGEQVTAASDWYSFGAMLFEAFAGHPPFVGTPETILEQKHRSDPLPPSNFSKDVPPDLDCLCHELLRRNPMARPLGAEVLARLVPGESQGALIPARPRAIAAFVGRARELAELDDAFRRTGDRSLVVAVEGESGIGKTALVRKFIAELRALPGERPPLVLSGRCSERERIPFKAFDEIAHKIAEAFSDADVVGPLVQTPGFGIALQGAATIFPVLADAARCLAGAPTQMLDSLARRSMAFQGVREIVRLLARQSRVIVCIDDWQWADADSSALLSGILAGAAPPPVLVILLQRDKGDDDAPACKRLAVGNLDADEAESLVRELLENEGLSLAGMAPSARSIAAESTGHPLFILELVQQVMSRGYEARSCPRLDDVLWSRFCALQPVAKQAAQLLACARAPIAFSVLCDAMATLDAPVEWADRPRLMHRLQSEHFARFEGLGGSDRVDCFHDRVASAILSRLPPSDRRACHRAIAVALENAATLDFESLTAHWLGADDPCRAARCAETAAARAMEGLAFERAVELYGLCLKLREGDESLCDIRAKLGEALSHLGRGREAAKQYLAAAVLADKDRSVLLHRLAADQLFRTGHFDAAVRLAEQVFQALGLPFPKSRWNTWLRLVAKRIRLRLRGDRFQRRDASTLSPRLLARVDAVWSVAVGLGMVDNFRGSYIQSCHLHMALELGEPFRVLRAVAMEVSYRATEGTSARRAVERCIQGAEALARELGDPYAFGFTHLTRGIGTFLCADWPQAQRACQSAEAIFENRPAMASWELASARLFLLFSHFFLGDLATLGRRVPELVREAMDRGDLFAAINLRLSVCNAAWLVADEPREARRHLQESENCFPAEGGYIQRYWSAIAWANLCLYEGRAEEAYHRAVAALPTLRRSMLLRMEFVRVEFLWLRGRCALASAKADRANRPRLLREAESCALRLARERADWAKALAHFICAGAQSLRGSNDASDGSLRHAIRSAEAVDLGLLTLVTTGRTASSIKRARDECSLDQVVARPDRWRAMLIPGP